MVPKRGWVKAFICLLLVLILAWLLLQSLRYRPVVAAKETRTQNLITTLANACKMYERDWNAFPPMDAATFDSGPCVYALSRPGPKGQLYMDFSQGDTTNWPLSPKSHLVNPVNPKTVIKYRNNAALPRPAGGPPVQHASSFDIWAEDADGLPTGINNWRANR